MSVKNAYIPEIEGKEKRKDAPSKEGFLGVEGIEDEIIVNAVMSQTQQIDEKGEKIIKTDFFELGLTGREDSSQKRAELCKKLGLPVKISANQLISTLNNLYTKAAAECGFPFISLYNLFLDYCDVKNIDFCEILL